MNTQVIQALGLLLVTFFAFGVVFTILLQQIEEGRSTVEDEWHETHYALAMSRALDELHEEVSTSAVEQRLPDVEALGRFEQEFLGNLESLRGYQLSQSEVDPEFQAEEGRTLADIEGEFEWIRASLGSAGTGGAFSEAYFATLSPRFEGLEQDIDSFVATTEREVGEAIGMIGRAQGRFKRALIAWVASLLFIVTLFFAGFTAYFVLPITRLNRAVQRIARRDFNGRVPIDRNNELGELAEAINSMAEALAQFTSRIEGELERSQRLASLGRLAAGIAHEINNPMASIAACSEGLLKRWEQAEGRGAGATAQDIEYLKLIREEVHRCKGITEKLLGLSRERPAHFGPFDLAVVTREVVDLVRHSPGGKQAMIRFQSPGEAAYCRGDANQIKQVVLNLMLNAIDAVKDGGEIEVRLENRKEWVRLSVADTGAGMSTEELNQAFEPFYTTKEPGIGTGIGLSLSHAIIKAHEGRLLATSQGKGRGSVFTVRLPRWREGRGSSVRQEAIHAAS